MNLFSSFIILVCAAIFTGFKCYPDKLLVNGIWKKRLQADLDLDCSDTFGVAFLGFIYIVLGVPLLGLLLLVKNRKLLKNSNFKRSFGFIYDVSIDKRKTSV
jgi:hypothetical protein